MGLRPGPRLPVLVSAQGDPTLEYLHLAQRALVVARRMGQAWKQKLSQAPGALPSARVVPKNSAGWLESPPAHLNLFAKDFALAYLSS